jgi:hypothetical protein
MSRITTALCLAFLAAGPTSIEAHAEPSAACKSAGLKAAERQWRENPRETQQIGRTEGRVTRHRSDLILRLNSGVSLRFNDMQASDDNTCGYDGDVLYLFQGIVGTFALIEVAHFEWNELMLVDLESGAKTYAEGSTPIIAPDGNHLILNNSGYTGYPAIALVKLSHPPQVATVPGQVFYRDSASWRNGRTLDLSAMQTL